MARLLRLLIDTNVILDVLQRREPHFLDSARVVAAAESGRCQGVVAAHTVTTIFYLVAKYSSPETARLQISEMLRFLDVAGVDRAVLLQALTMPYADFEDAVQMTAAGAAGADFIVTRDLGDFARGPLPALTPAEALALLPAG
jgi:predicted nucleic acid-binding protein